MERTAAATCDDLASRTDAVALDLLADRRQDVSACHDDAFAACLRRREAVRRRELGAHRPGVTWTHVLKLAVDDDGASIEVDAAVNELTPVGASVDVVTVADELRRVITVANKLMDDAYGEPSNVRALLADIRARFQAIAATNGAVNPFSERLVRGTDAAVALVPPRSLVDGLLFTPSVAVLYGAPKSGKSVLALDLALHVAACRPFWHGRAVTGGRVLYITGGGVGGLPQRVAAWLKHHGQAQVDGITWLTVAPNLLKPEQVDQLAAIVADLQPTLVVIDTLARSMLGGDDGACQPWRRSREVTDAPR
jgi:hypothetical protein